MMPVQTAPKARSGLTRDFIARQAPTMNATSMIASLPGVAVGRSDPLGLDDQRNSLTVRGLDQTEIGYVMEGIPAADPRNYKLFTSQNVDSEDVARIDLTQGSSDVSSPLYNAVGGELSQTWRDPSHKTGGALNVSGGSYSLDREYARIETGDIGNTGLRSFVSFSHTHADAWRGPRYITRYHMDTKTTKEWDGGKTSLLISYSNTTNNPRIPDLPNMTQWKEYGTNFNYSKYYTTGDSNYYQLQQNNRRALLIGLPTRIDLTHGLTLNTTPYYLNAAGWGGVGTTLSNQNSYNFGEPAGNLNISPSTNGRFTAASDDIFRELNAGINSSLAWKKGNNTLTFGYWYAYYTQPEYTSYAAATASGVPASMAGRYPVTLSNGNPLLSYNINFKQETNALYISDRYTALNGKLILEAAFKEAMITRQNTQQAPASLPYKNGHSDARPLPQVAISYAITPHNQIYINGTTGFREPSGWTNYADFVSVSTGNVSRQHTSDLQPEYSISEEIGFRHHGDFNLSLALFNYNFTNRQISTTEIIGGANVATSLNGGGQTSRGVTAELGLKPWHHFSPYISVQYIDARINNNLRAGNGDYLRTKGKFAVNTPKVTASLGISYDDGSTFGHLSLNYIDKQYSTFMNDQSLPEYETMNIALGYRFRSYKFLRSPQIQLNLVNVVGSPGYLSGTYTVTTNARQTTGVYGTKIAGSAPVYDVGGGFAGIVSMSTGF